MSNILSVEKELNFQSEVLTLSLGKDTIQWITPPSRIHLFKLSFPSRFSRSKSAIRWLEQHTRDYDLFVIHSVWTMLAQEAALLFLKKGVPYMIWPHGSLDPFDLQKKSHLKKLLGPLVLRSTLRSAACVCCTTQVEAERIETYGASITKSVLPLPISTGGEQGNRSRFRKRYRFMEEDFVMLFMSRIDYKKGLDLIIPVMSQSGGEQSADCVIDSRL